MGRLLTTSNKFTGFLYLFFILCLLRIDAANAMDSTWVGGTGVYNTPANWNPVGVPGGQANRAIFANGGNTAITFTANAPTVGRVLFPLGAQIYTINLSRRLTINGNAADAGIVN